MNKFLYSIWWKWRKYVLSRRCFYGCHFLLFWRSPWLYLWPAFKATVYLLMSFSFTQVIEFSPKPIIVHQDRYSIDQQEQHLHTSPLAEGPILSQPKTSHIHHSCMPPLTLVSSKAHFKNFLRAIKQTERAHFRKSLDMASVAIKFVSLILFAYFVYHIVNAVEKLWENKIGTTVTHKNARAIPYPSMTFCPFNNK